MIKAVLFDFGGVLAEGGKSGSIRASFSRLYGIPPQDIDSDECTYKAFIGEYSDTEYIAAMNRRHPQAPPATVESFVGTADLFTRCEPVYALAASLRTHGVVTGILSNTLRTSTEKLRAGGFYDGFDPIILSYEVHLAKPNPEVYALSLQRLNVPADEVLFIDDRADFLTPAQDLGMHVILASTPAQIVRDTTLLFVKENSLHL